MSKTKQALIVSPYLDHLGGGERYMLQIASALQDLDYQTYFAWNDASHIVSLAQQLGIKLKKPKLHSEIYQLYFQNNPLKMYLATKRYDLVFYLSDGSLPFLGGKKNIVHMQVPFHQVKGKSLKNRFKLRTINQIIVNSKFTKKVIDREYGVSSLVVYPPVNLPSSPPTSKKQNLILSVGRFEPSLNVKKQDILIKAFKQLSPQLPDWKLVLAGGAKPGTEAWLDQLRHLAKGFPIELKPNLSYMEIQQLYQQAAIYWHGAGYEVDETQHPELVEHFGITTVEAIAHGCLPLVVPKGGQPEIIPNSQYHWLSFEDLIKKTLTFAYNLDNYQPQLDLNSFSVATFNKQIKKLVYA